MNYKKTHTVIVVTLALLFLTTSCKQSSAQESWSIYSFSNICSFRIPNTMELRDPDSKVGVFINEAVNRISIEFGQTIANRKITFQPRGMNSSDREEVIKATSLYSRIIVADIIDDDIPSQQYVASLTSEEIDEVEAIFKDDVESLARQLNVTVDWVSFRREKIAGKYALVSVYKRPSQKGGLTYVEEYKFFMKTHLLRITLSYREDESKLWKDDFSNIMETLSFN